MITKLDEIAAKARSDKKLRFTSLAHLITPGFLMETWMKMNRRGAAGVDRETTAEFEAALDERIGSLYDRVRRGVYRPPPVRRVEIPKGNGKTRSLGIPTVEDRLLQAAVARILSAVYEEDFLDISFGYRPRRSAIRPIALGRKNWMFCWTEVGAQYTSGQRHSYLPSALTH